MFCYVDSNLYTAFKYMYTLAYCCDAYCTHVPVTIVSASRYSLPNEL